MDEPVVTIGRFRLSRLNAVALADPLIPAGKCEVVVAEERESTTQAPHPLRSSRAGSKYSKVCLPDQTAYDGVCGVIAVGHPIDGQDDARIGAVPRHGVAG